MASYDKMGEGADGRLVSGGVVGSDIPIGNGFTTTADDMRDLCQRSMDYRKEDNPGADHPFIAFGGISALERSVQSNHRTGLPGEELVRNFEDRRRHFGDNVAPQAPPKHFLVIYLNSLMDPMLIALMVVAAISLILGIAAPHEDGGWYEGVAILVAVLIVSVVATWNDWDKERRFRKLNTTKQNYDVKCIRDGVDQNVKTFDLVVGDLVLLAAGDEIPADGFFVSGHKLECDESAMTGEQMAVKKSPEGNPFMVSGSTVQNGTGRMVVAATGISSIKGQALKEMCDDLDDEGTPLQQKLSTLASQIGYVGMGAAVLTFIALMGKWGVDAGTGDAVRNQILARIHALPNVSGVPAPLRAPALTPVPSTATPVTTRTPTAMWTHDDVLADLVRRGVFVQDASPQVVAAAKEFLDTLDEHKYPPLTARSFGLRLIDAVLIAITIVVVAVPEGLPLAVTMSLAYSVQKMLADQALVRKLQACETMGCATTICSDKTGTLTLNRMTVTGSWTGGTTEFPPKALSGACVQNICVNSTANILYVQADGKKKQPEGKGADGAAGKKGAARDNTQLLYQGSPTEGALLLLLDSMGDVAYSEVRAGSQKDVLTVFPFDSNRKTMGTLLALKEGSTAGGAGAAAGAEGGVRAPARMLLKGASEIVLDMCDTAAYDGPEGPGTVVKPLTAEDREAIKKAIYTFATQGLRTLLLAYRDFATPAEVADVITADAPPTGGYTVSILVGIKDPLRPAVIKCIERCGQAGITVRMVTGDNVVTAEHISREAAIIPEGQLAEGVVMEGPTFRNLPRKEMLKMLPRLRVLARSTPLDKKILVAALRELGEVVGVTGDGSNDGPALKGADVGLAMGSGTEVAKAASDIVILDDNFESIVRAVEWGRSVYANIRRFLQFQLTVNISALVVTFVTSFTSSGPPLTALQLLWVNVIMDSFAALALATEPPGPTLLSRKPSDYKRLITGMMWKHITAQAIYQVFILLGFFFLLLGGQLNGPFMGESLSNDTPVIRALVFNAFVFCQVFNELNCRKVEDEFNIFSGIIYAKPFVVIMVVTLVLQILFIELMPEEVAGTYPLSAAQWFVSVMVGFGSLPLRFIVRAIPFDAILMRLVACCNKDDDEESGDDDDSSKKSDDNDEDMKERLATMQAAMDELQKKHDALAAASSSASASEAASSAEREADGTRAVSSARGTVVRGQPTPPSV
eukprot:TRINITY_DN100_c0_g2_i1.p1 TRINITY_DN100_c0_g2~~TRINITY_DN100_c0_g2_i1.p1  ORF type:complete len:1204 (-),score=408.04 TRINITY_DN100_c0_g2_i1:741-4352(-)